MEHSCAARAMHASTHEKFSVVHLKAAGRNIVIGVLMPVTANRRIIHSVSRT
jgi:hypothetical protein